MISNLSFFRNYSKTHFSFRLSILYRDTLGYFRCEKIESSSSQEWKSTNFFRYNEGYDTHIHNDKPKTSNRPQSWIRENHRTKSEYTCPRPIRKQTHCGECFTIEILSGRNHSETKEFRQWKHWSDSFFIRSDSERKNFRQHKDYNKSRYKN